MREYRDKREREREIERETYECLRDGEGDVREEEE
jgi:hypothetical protein